MATCILRFSQQLNAAMDFHHLFHKWENCKPYAKCQIHLKPMNLKRFLERQKNRAPPNGNLLPVSGGDCRPGKIQRMQ